jgi:hypothetical protein
MSELFIFIITLPIKITVAITICVWFVLFGLARGIPVMPIKYDDWYDSNMDKLTKILRWE